MTRSRLVKNPPTGTLDADRAVRWSGSTLLDALQTATAHFEPQAASINALNVFPVPDGDTGTNMLLTLQAAVREARKLDHDGQPPVGEVLARAARGALMGSRGNSGVILYQILLGIAEGGVGAVDLDGAALAGGLRRAADLAYRAVANPVEGTMLTVIRAAAVAAEAAARRDGSIAAVIAAALEAAEEALRRTPELLDILREAGVVDAGGQGLVTLFDGLERFIRGATLEMAAPAGLAATEIGAAMPFLDRLDELHGTEEFGYCINFLISGESLPVDALRARLTRHGSSAVVVGDPRTLKVHIHSEHPGLVLEAALEFGELQQVRIDNMSAQTERLLEERQTLPAGARATVPEVGIGVVAVASGDGISAALRGMGAAAIVPGGPTFNPSTADILRAVESLPRPEVIILPNDPNVIPTARQVEKLTRRVTRVVPSRSIPQGISALAAFNFDTDLDDNVARMTDALRLVQSLSLTRATRDAQIGQVRVRAGEYIGLLDGDLRAGGADPVAVVLDLFALAGAADAELATLFAGAPASSDVVERIRQAIAERYPHLTVEVTPGGQPHFELIIALE